MWPGEDMKLKVLRQSEWGDSRKDLSGSLGDKQTVLGGMSPRRKGQREGAQAGGGEPGPNAQRIRSGGVRCTCGDGHKMDFSHKLRIKHSRKSHNSPRQ